MADEDDSDSVLEAVNRRERATEAESSLEDEEAEPVSEGEITKGEDAGVEGNESEAGIDSSAEDEEETVKDGSEVEEEDPDFPATGAKLAEHQPESTLPPLRRPSLDRE